MCIAQQVLFIAGVRQCKNGALTKCLSSEHPSNILTPTEHPPNVTSKLTTSTVTFDLTVD
jgi:hypothetical protein